MVEARKIICKAIINGMRGIFQPMFIQLVFTINRSIINRIPDSRMIFFGFVFSLMEFIFLGLVTLKVFILILDFKISTKVNPIKMVSLRETVKSKKKVKKNVDVQLDHA